MSDLEKKVSGQTLHLHQEHIDTDTQKDHKKRKVDEQDTWCLQCMFEAAILLALFI